MNETQKVQYLVVDTSAFIRNVSLQDIGINIITEQDVVNEVINKRQLKRLVVLPYDLTIQNADSKNIKFVTEFAKKTGDYTSLSATDIKVIALTYQLEKEKGNPNLLQMIPKIAQTVPSKPRKTQDFERPSAGFYMPEIMEYISKDKENGNKVTQPYTIEEQVELTFNLFDKLHMHPKNTKDAASHEYNQDDSDENKDDIDNDNSGWITPGNIFNVKKELDCNQLEEKSAIVACLTVDFAMQNVLKQIGLNVVALDGRIIKQVRTYILRCYACFKTTSIMTKVFCPNCGNKTLKKVGVSLNAQGMQQIHINFRKPISKKGKRFPLPMPKGGKHAINPILVEDQPVPDQRLSKLARAENDPLKDDYVAGYSPFVTRDVYSKSAMLGMRQGGSFKYWMKKNPNECQRRRK